MIWLIILIVGSFFVGIGMAVAWEAWNLILPIVDNMRHLFEAPH